MDIATLIGLLGGSALIFGSIAIGGSVVLFINAPGLLIVLGGTLAVCFIKFSLGDVLNSIKVGMKAFMFKIDPAVEVIERMVSYSRIAKKEGLMALEKQQPGDEFTAKALRYLADGYDEELIRSLLTKDLRFTVERHMTGKNVFKAMGDTAPAFGMIGTLIGLVQMLSNMSDPRSIGPAMAVALLTTLYGALIANFICIPIADKLGLRSQQEQQAKSIVIEACVGMNRGLSPIVLEEALKVYLAPKIRRKDEAGAGQQEGAPA